MEDMEQEQLSRDAHLCPGCMEPGKKHDSGRCPKAVVLDATPSGKAERLFEAEHVTGFVVRDSGKREEFVGGMVRDTGEGKLNYLRCLEGPMLDRWAAHLELGAEKYPDVEEGVANWTLANDSAALVRFKMSALRHCIQWIHGDRDEDHAAAIFFNVNGGEYVRAKLG